MNTPIKESNLAQIGSEEDHAAKKAAADCEVNWDGVGEEVGIKIWRVENEHENGIPKFGIKAWPEKLYGNFYTGDSYIVISTTKDEGNSLLYDIYFWIGKESSTDEYGVAAYKANELDEKLGDSPIQHREDQYAESEQFLGLFGDDGIKYLDGGIDGGFHHVEENADKFLMPNRLFHIRRLSNRNIRCVQVQCEFDSLNNGDAFVLDAGNVVYTWYGKDACAFEKQKAVTVAQNFANAVGRNGASLEAAVGDDNKEFWCLLGGKGTIKEADDFKDVDFPDLEKPKMYIVNDDNNELKVHSVPAEKSKLVTDDVCLIDVGKTVFVWVGKGSTKREQQEAMLMTQQYFKALKKSSKVPMHVVRIIEGQESRVCNWPF